jgi:hypothetical protein
MPIVSFSQLPDDARVWVFAASDPLPPANAGRLLDEVDAFLEQWQAHGEPLTCARDRRDDRFVVIGVDQSTAGASGCSIDGLFRALQRLQSSLGTTLVGGGRVFYRDNGGTVRCVDRREFSRRAAAGAVGPGTAVFDLSVTTAGAYREGFERPARDSWHRELLTAGDSRPAAPSATRSG